MISKMYEKINANRLQALQAQLPECKGMQSEQMGFNPNHRVENALHGIVKESSTPATTATRRWCSYQPT
jgi:hypothetical protein